MCAAYLEYWKPIRMGVVWNFGNQLRCQFLGMGTNSDTADRSNIKYAGLLGLYILNIITIPNNDITFK